jgi:hypothetical protein
MPAGTSTSEHDSTARSVRTPLPVFSEPTRRPAGPAAPANTALRRPREGGSFRQRAARTRPTPRCLRGWPRCMARHTALRACKGERQDTESRSALRAPMRVGTWVGADVGAAVGAAEGLAVVGTAVGADVGCEVGAVGAAVGLAVGAVGAAVGATVTWGASCTLRPPARQSTRTSTRAHTHVDQRAPQESVGRGAVLPSDCSMQRHKRHAHEKRSAAR